MISLLSDNKNDQHYKQLELTTSNPVRMYVEQIKMAIESEHGSIMGATTNFDLEDLVFEQGLSENDIEKEVRGAISGFCSLYPNFDTEVKAYFTKGEYRDICIIDIFVNGELAEKVFIS